MGKSISNRVRELRQRGEGMTQLQLAAAVGVSRQTIIAIERGRYSPSLEVALKLARQLNEPVERIFTLAPD